MLFTTIITSGILGKLMFISTGCYNLCYSLALHAGLEQQTGWPQLPAIVWVIRIAVINMSFFSNNSFLFCIALSESPQTKWSLSSFWGNISNSQVDAGFLSLAAKSFTFLCSNWFQLWNLWGFFFFLLSCNHQCLGWYISTTVSYVSVWGLSDEHNDYRKEFHLALMTDKTCSHIYHP